MSESTPDLSVQGNSRFHKPDTCGFCGRQTRLTFHHLIPKKLHRRPFYRKHYSKETLNLGVFICRLCHDGIHDLYDEMTLAKHFSSTDALLADEALARHFAWVARQRMR